MGAGGVRTGGNPALELRPQVSSDLRLKPPFILS